MSSDIYLAGIGGIGLFEYNPPINIDHKWLANPIGGLLIEPEDDQLLLPGISIRIEGGINSDAWKGPSLSQLDPNNEE